MSRPVDHKYRWLLNQLMHSNLSRKEITDRWRRTEGVEISRETFINWKNAVESFYNIIIECDTSNGYRYYIPEEYKEKIRGNHINNWELKIMELSDAIAKHKKLQDRILVEEVPSGNEMLEAFLDAMEDNHVISIEYTKYFNNPEEKTESYEFCPYCVKQFERGGMSLASALIETKCAPSQSTKSKRWRNRKRLSRFLKTLIVRLISNRFSASSLEYMTKGWGKSNLNT